jgi:hypothetical protein
MIYDGYGEDIELYGSPSYILRIRLVGKLYLSRVHVKFIKPLEKVK